MYFWFYFLFRFLDRNPQGIERAGHTWGGVQRQKEDGYTRDVTAFPTGPNYDATATLRRLEPYAARSIQAANVYFDDHTHDAKSVVQRSMTSVY